VAVLPARTTVQSVIWGGMKVEIDVIARKSAAEFISTLQQGIGRLLYHADYLCQLLTDLDTEFASAQITASQLEKLPSLMAVMLEKQWLADSLHEVTQLPREK